MKNDKVQTSFYITQDIRDLVKFLCRREEVTKTTFYKKAIRFFFEEDTNVDPRILITERSNPAYIRRDVLETMQFEAAQKEQIIKAAEEQDCNEGHIIFQALVNYCALLLSIDSTGVTFED